MKIAVIAANGRSGLVFLDKALSAGHSIRAGVYGSTDIKPRKNLSIVGCDATKQADVEELIKGQDAVVCLIGHGKNSPADVQTEAMRIVLKAMAAAKVKRLVSLTGTGVRFPGDKITLLDRLLNVSIGLIDPARVKDGINHVQLLKTSDLDWTVIRVLKLQNVAEHAYTLRQHGPTKPYVSRDEVAASILEVLQEHTFIKQAPIIAN